MKKGTVRWGVAFFLCALTGLLVWTFWLRSPKTYAERYPNQIGVTKETCECLLNDHKGFFDTLVLSLTSYINETDLHCAIYVDEKGRIDMPKQLRQDDDLVAAIEDIFSDNLFRTNPLHIFVRKTENGFVAIEVLLEYMENACYVSLEYREIGVAFDETRINDYWFWNVFFMI